MHLAVLEPRRRRQQLRRLGDIIGVGLKHDADVELDPGAFRFRLTGSRFRWRKHCDERYAGFRLIEDAGALHSTPVDQAAARVADVIAAQLVRARALPTGWENIRRS